MRQSFKTKRHLESRPTKLWQRSSRANQRKSTQQQKQRKRIMSSRLLFASSDSISFCGVRARAMVTRHPRLGLGDSVSLDGLQLLRLLTTNVRVLHEALRPESDTCYTVVQHDSACNLTQLLGTPRQLEERVHRTSVAWHLSELPRK